MLESRLVVVRCCARLLLVGAAVTYSALASALGLGEITVHSALDQPLRADIALVDAAGLEEGELSVNLATADEFSRAGVERVFFLNDLRFTPILRGNRSVIQVTSNKPVNEPFLNFLVQLNQPNGRLLREYTVLIDPPGSPGIVPANDEPLASRPSSAFPSVQPAVAPVPTRKEPKPATAPASDPLAEQLAASVLANQQLQSTIDELNAKLQAQDEQIAADKKQVSELQTQLAEVQQAAAKPSEPPVIAPAPVVASEPETNWLLIVGLMTLLALLLLGWFVRRRHQVVASPEPATDYQPAPSPAQPLMPTPALQPTPAERDETPASDVLEGVDVYLTYGRFSEAIGLLREAMVKEPQRKELAVKLLEVLGRQGDVAAYATHETSLLNAGFDTQKLRDIRASYPVMNALKPVAVTAIPVLTAGDEFQLNLDDLSMDASWDLGPLEIPSTTALSESDIEWEVEPVSPSLDDSFLDEFAEPVPLLALEPLKLERAEPNNAGKLEKAQACINDGDLDSAIELLNELLKNADEPLRQTARNLLAGIR
ncbi:FimV/HubP family polar landmark protein [Pseudomonas sp. PD9R]|uniref:FimV/HubP family polar landmark protein n=1 Tax=Pseudomonas sp. PD9R TaxID=2853534 RepID=UPI001C47674B|nr:FimV/HubP family polar landmark protein [Pseudomonas sp. PD9R]MBV6823767.1 peptidoglycan-binding protein LysM [Pseudomonas sp. PD9R]